VSVLKRILFLILAPIYIPAAVLLFLTFEWWSDLWSGD
jgi:hypothetical protein